MTARKMWSLGAAIAIAVLWGCTSNNAATLPDADFFVTEGRGFLLRIGDTAGVQTPSAIVVVTFNDVLSDSRCPEGVTCVSAGEAVVEVTVQSALNVQDIEFAVPPEGGANVVVEELTLEIVDLTPAAVEGVRIDLLDYELALVVRETGSIAP